MAASEPNYRAGTVADAEALARLVIDGFEEYRSFAPDGWSPPPLADEVERLHELLPDPASGAGSRRPTASSSAR